MGHGRITDPTNREELKIYIRSILGEPIITLNVTEFQVDQAVDEALKYFRDYHYLGSTHTYYYHPLTAQEITNREFTVPDDLFGVVKMYDAASNSASGIAVPDVLSPGWSIQWDLMYNAGTTNGGFLNIVMNQQYYDLINQLLVGMKPIEFNMHQNKVRLDTSVATYQPGSPIILDGYMILDPDAYPEIWADRWLIRYAAAKVKRQWGENLSKFSGTLPGGMQVNYDRIIQESQAEITNIEENMIRDYSEPPRDFLG